MKKKSVKEAVIAYVKKAGPVRAADVIKATGRDPAQVYTALSSLLKGGTLDKFGNEYIINGPDMTAIKPDISTPEEHSTSRRATDMEMKLGRQTAQLEAQVKDLQEKLHDASVKYFDACAVIKYLESKIIAQFGK